MIFKKKVPTEDPKNTMPPLDTEEEDTPDRGGGGAKWVTLLCVILAIALLVSSLPSGISSSTSVNAKSIPIPCSKTPSPPCSPAAAP